MSVNARAGAGGFTAPVLTLLRGLVLACTLVASLAFAQPASYTLYVFKDGLPVPNIEVLIDDRVVGLTNDDGVARLSVAPGLHYLELRDQDLVVLSQSLLSREDELSQWIVNITRGLSSLVDVESSAPLDVGGDMASESDSPDTTGPPGTLSLGLVNVDGGEGVAGARIFIAGQPRDFTTGEDGRLTVELAPGSYAVSVLHSGFNTLTRDSIVVASGETTELGLELTPTGTELPEFVVIEPYIAGSLASVLEERRTEAAVANILGAEQISKAGDSDAAGALRRVTGLTLVDGRFIYIRGLGERYSSTLLNGANVPSPDPTRRVVPLDLFPTGIVDSIAVKKGFTHDLPGEFGGGTVELRTKRLPEVPFFSADISLGYREGTTGKKGLTYAGGSNDWTGYDDGIRDQSEELQDATADGTRLVPFNRFTGEGYTPEELQVVGRSLDSNWDIFETTVDPNLSANLSGGYVWDDLKDGVKFGVLAAIGYKNEWVSTTQQRTDYVNAGGGELAPENDFTYLTTVRFIDFSSFITAGLELSENHKFTYNWMLLRNTTDKAQIEQGFNKDAEGGDVRFFEMEWIEREMKANQFLGEHTFSQAGGLYLKWQYTNAVAGSWEPDTRRYRYDPDRTTPNEDDFIFSIRNDSNQRRWSELDDDSKSWNVDFLQPLEIWDNTDLAIAMGFNRVEKGRDSSIRRFAYISKGPISRDEELRRNPSVEDIIFFDTIDPRGWQLEEVTIATDAYTAEQVIKAWHLGFDVNVGETLRIAGGFRDESSSMKVVTFNLFDPENRPVVSGLDTDDIFPSLTATWFAGNHQVRAGFAETINRPDFKELSESLYKDPLLDRLVKGNPDLLPAFITHYDLRWDYYFNPGEFISLGVFYKEFIDPIESVIQASAGNQLTTFDNAESAENFGVEFEFYKTFDFVNDWWGWGEIWGNFYLNTNYAWIESEITLKDRDDTIQTSDQRPLQGQSPYVWNFQVGYDDADREINAALLYNVFGERIVDVGVQGAPDIYEQPRPSLDFVYSQGFGRWKLKAKVKNILDPDIELTQGEETKRLIEAVGREWSVGFEYTFK